MRWQDDPSEVDVLLEAVKRHAGKNGLEAFYEAFGGVEIRIPRSVDEHHPISKAIGFKAAQAVCHHMRVDDADGHSIGRLRLLIPLGAISERSKQTARLDALLIEGGQSVRSIAVKARVHERTAWRRRKLLVDEGKIKPGPSVEMPLRRRKVSA